jgi:hypothetical protein
VCTTFAWFWGCCEHQIDTDWSVHPYFACVLEPALVMRQATGTVSCRDFSKVDHVADSYGEIHRVALRHACFDRSSDVSLYQDCPSVDPNAATQMNARPIQTPRLLAYPPTEGYSCRQSSTGSVFLA